MTPLPNGLPIIDWMKYSDVQDSFLSFWQSIPEMKLPADPELRRVVTVNDTSKAASVTVVVRVVTVTVYY